MSSQNNTVKEPDSVEGLARNQTGAVNEDCVSSKNRSRKRSLETDASDFDGTCSQDMYSKRSKSAGGTYTYKESQYSPIPEKPKRLLPGFLLESFKDNTNNQCSIKIEEKLSDDFFLTRNKDFRFSSAKKNSVRSFRSETRVVDGQDDDKKVPGFVSQIKNIDYKISKEELCSETQVKTISTRTDGVTHRVIGFLRSETATVSHSEHGRGRIAPISEKKKLESVITEQNSISEEEEDDSESLTSTDVSLPGFLRCISKKRKKGPRSSVQCSAPDSISKIPTSDLPVKSSDAEEEEDDKDSSTSKDAALPGFLRSASKKPKKKPHSSTQRSSPGSINKIPTSDPPIKISDTEVVTISDEEEDFTIPGFLRPNSSRTLVNTFKGAVNKSNGLLGPKKGATPMNYDSINWSDDEEGSAFDLKVPSRKIDMVLLGDSHLTRTRYILKDSEQLYKRYVHFGSKSKFVYFSSPGADLLVGKNSITRQYRQIKMQLNGAEVKSFLLSVGSNDVDYFLDQQGDSKTGGISHELEKFKNAFTLHIKKLTSKLLVKFPNSVIVLLKLWNRQRVTKNENVLNEIFSYINDVVFENLKEIFEGRIILYDHEDTMGDKFALMDGVHLNFESASSLVSSVKSLLGDLLDESEESDGSQDEGEVEA